jgi:hypothetical protein
MAYRKIEEGDLFLNTMKTLPQCEFFTWDGEVFYNSTPYEAGIRNTGSGPPTVLAAKVGYVSLYEQNVDRPNEGTNRVMGQHTPHTYTKLLALYESEDKPVDFTQDTGRIYPYITKDSARSSFKTVGNVSYNSEYQDGEVITFQYPLTASITREYIATPYTSTTSYNARYSALRNKLNFYAIRSPQYAVSSSEWNKDTQILNMLYIPSIFYGTKIEPGSVSLRWYYAGSLAGELRDNKQNGELIQQAANETGPAANENSGTCAGVVLYEEGVIVLTGSWALNDKLLRMGTGLGDESPRWIYWGAGTNDGLNHTAATMNSTFNSASFGLSFKGTTETQVMTMFAHAHRGAANFSNNPTFFKYGQNNVAYTSSHVYQENPEVLIANTVSSSYTDYTASFKRQVYISRIGVYDKNKNLIGLATLSNPVLKKEDQSYSFKLKLDV